MNEFDYIFKNTKSKLIRPASDKFKSAKKVQQELTGVDFIPPMNAITLNVSSIGLRSFRGIDDVPVEARSNFSWTNKADIDKYKSELKLPDNIMSPIYNQAKCGSCWAVSTAQAFSDRWAIANKTSNPRFSPTFLLSCAMKYQKESPDFKNYFPNHVDYLPMQGCNGGMPSDAVDFINKIGISIDSCWNYDWCLTSSCYTSSSRGAGADINELIPSCKEYNTCVNVTNGIKDESSTDKIYRAKTWGDVKKVPVPDIYFQSIDDTNPTKKIVTSIGSAKTFAPKDNKFNDHIAAVNVNNEIKEEIFKRGPVVACFDIIYSSFFGDRNYSPNFFRDTGAWIDDIYIHPNDTALEEMYDNSCIREGMNCQVGGHAVVIVGWGEKVLDFTKIPNFLRTGFSPMSSERDLYDRIKPIYENLRGKTIPYWIVRNSWGEHNIPNHTNGYFKMAMTNFDLRINRYPALDVPKMKYGYLFGGVTAMLPDLSADKFATGTATRDESKLIISGKEYGTQDSVNLQPVFKTSENSNGENNNYSTFLKKNKWYIIAGISLFVIIIFLILKNKK